MPERENILTKAIRKINFIGNRGFSPEYIAEFPHRLGCSKKQPLEVSLGGSLPLCSPGGGTVIHGELTRILICPECGGREEKNA